MNWQELHSNSTVVDLHTHPNLKSSIFHRNLGSKKPKFISKFFKEKFWPFSDRVTFPKMEEGGVDTILATSYILEQGWIDDMSIVRKLFWLFPSVRKKIVDPSYFDATNAMMDDIEKQVSNYDDYRDINSRGISLVRSSQELENALDAGDMCVIHSIEGAHSLQGDESGKKPLNDLSDTKSAQEEILYNLEHFFNRGAAYLGLAHFYPNHCVNPVFPYPEYGSSHLDWRTVTGKWDETKGLTPIGVKVVEKMLDMGMLIDISHCTLAARKQIYELVTLYNKSECLIASHTGAFEVNRLSYNLQDWELKWLAEHGCVVGIIFMNYWISPVDSGLGLKHIEKTIDYITNLCGNDCVAIGTDFDGFTDPPDEIVDMSELPRITGYLKGLGYSDSKVKKFLGENALRILKNGWKK